MPKKLLLLSIATVAMLLTACERLSEEEALKQAAEAVNDGYPSVALEKTEQCLKRNPENMQALVLRGISHHMLRRPDEAIADLEAAVALEPDNFSALFFLGWLLTEDARYADALEPLRRAHSIKPSHADVLVLLATCCLEQNLPEGTSYLQALRRHKSFEQSAAVYNGLGYLWTTQGNYEAARKDLLRAWKNDPHKPVVLHNLAILYDQYLKDPAKAHRFYLYTLAACQQAQQVERQAVILERLRQIVKERDIETPPDSE